MNEQPRLVVGFDLDMTLVDSRAGVAATLSQVAREVGVALDLEAVRERLGPPLDQMLAGAHDALAAVRRHGGETVVVTGEFTANAALHVAAREFEIDHLVGEVWGVGKGAVLREHGATIYVGDHVHDVEGARAAGALSVSVLTGGCTEAELRAAGTDVVLPDLTEFPAWLDEHVLRQRLDALDERLRECGSVMVAFSGGADSAFLLAAAVRSLGAEHVAAATAYSDSLPQGERSPALDFARSLDVRVFTPQTHEMERTGYRANAGDRCYFCKAELLDVLGPLAAEHGFARVATGTNADDAVAGFRPGIRAADERGAITPLRDAGLTKGQIREASRRWSLPTWDKPAAACLSSRIAYGVEVSPFRLSRVERAEVAVRSAMTAAGLQVRNLRVRDLGERARVEVDADLVEPAASLPAVTDAVLGAGFDTVEIDPKGFRSGALNELLTRPEAFR